jgi:hypothetical protein
VRSRFAPAAAAGAAGGGGEDFGPFLAALRQLGFRKVQQDAANRMFVVWVLQLIGGKAAGSGRSNGGKQQQQQQQKAPGIRWPALKACVYKKR